MKKKRFTEEELLDGLEPYAAHADELAEPQGNEPTALERLKGSVLRYERPTDPVWDECFEAEGVTEDFMENRDQPDNKEQK